MSAPEANLRMNEPAAHHDRFNGPLQDMAGQLFFIVGVGRSGTTLLASMISAHPEAIVPNETRFYTVLLKRRRNAGPIDSEQTFHAAVKSILDSWYIRDLDLDEAMVYQLCEGQPRSWETIFLAILAQYGEKHGRKRVGEKSPAHLHQIDMLARLFPNAKFIHIIRDPRAVALSHQKAAFSSGCVAPRIASWRKAIEIHQNATDRLNTDRYLLARYEDLVEKPESVLRGICDLIGLEFHEQMLSPEQRQVKGFSDRQVQHMSNTLKPLFTSSIDRWKTELSQRHIGLIEKELGQHMLNYGYTLTGTRTRFPRTTLAASWLRDVGFRIRKKLAR